VDCTTEGTICIEAGVQIYPTLALYKDGWRQEVYAKRRTALHLKQFVWDRLSSREEEGSEAQPDGVSQIKKSNRKSEHLNVSEFSRN
jgi:hypothetical protein